MGSVTYEHNLDQEILSNTGGNWCFKRKSNFLYISPIYLDIQSITQLSETLWHKEKIQPPVGIEPGTFQLTHHSDQSPESLTEENKQVVT